MKILCGTLNLYNEKDFFSLFQFVFECEMGFLCVLVGGWSRLVD